MRAVALNSKLRLRQSRIDGDGVLRVAFSKKSKFSRGGHSSANKTVKLTVDKI